MLMMKGSAMKKRLYGFALALAFIAAPLLADEKETDWIEPVEGYQEQGIGARVVTIETIPMDGSKRMTLAIPKQSLDNVVRMEEIVVIGREPDKQERRIEVDYQWVTDYEDDYYGLVLRFGGENSVPIRLYLKSAQ